MHQKRERQRLKRRQRIQLDEPHIQHHREHHRRQLGQQPRDHQQKEQRRLPHHTCITDLVAHQIAQLATLARHLKGHLRGHALHKELRDPVEHADEQTGVLHGDEHQRDLEHGAGHDLRTQIAIRFNARRVARQLQREHDREHHRRQRLDGDSMHVHRQLVKSGIPCLRRLGQQPGRDRTGTSAADHVEHGYDEVLHGRPRISSAQSHRVENLRGRDDHASTHDLPQSRLRLRPIMILQAAAECDGAPHQPQPTADGGEPDEQLKHLIQQIHDGLL